MSSDALVHFNEYLIGRPVEQLAVCLANKQKSAVEVKVQQLCKASAKLADVY